MVYTLGESLLDIIIDNPEDINARPGGSMLNTAVSLGRSGVRVSLISELGDDGTAGLILQFLKENKVGNRYVKKYYHQQTTVALAFLDENKIPSFTIYKSYPVNRRLLLPQHFSENDILAFGSLYSLDPAIREQVVQILATARKEGVFMIYDPNIRQHNLNEKALKQALKENIAFADIIKGSVEDFENIFGKKSHDGYFEEIRKINPAALFVLTRGENGVTGFFDDETIQLPAEKVKVVSTIGAGDAFTAGMIHYLEKKYDKRGNGHGKPHKTEKSKRLSKTVFKAMLESGLRFSAKVCELTDNYVPSNFS